MRTFGKISFFVCLLAAQAAAQSHLQGPPSAGSGPTFDVSLGYTYLGTTVPNGGRVNLNGLDATGRVDFSPHWGVLVDSGYVHTANVLGTGHSGFDLTFLGGPVLYPLEHRNTRLLVYGLVGAGLVDGAVPVNGTNYLGGWVARPAYALGGGIEHLLPGPFAVRITGDYLHTSYADAAGAVQGQNNFRMTASLVLHLNEHRRF